MTTKTELLDLIKNGENSGVEFKRDELKPEALAKELVAFSNFDGGMVLLGVDDGGVIIGINKSDVEEWVMTVCRDLVRPAIIPFFSLIKEVEPGKDVAVVRVMPGLNVHTLWRKNKHEYFIRVGSQSREPSPEELSRLFQQKGGVRAEKQPITGAKFTDLDLRRLKDYFKRVRGQSVPESDDEEEWVRQMQNADFMMEGSVVLATLLLFGRNPGRYAYQAGVDATAYSGKDKDYDYRDQMSMGGAMVPLLNAESDTIETGYVEQTQEFVRRNTKTTAVIENGARRKVSESYPENVVREGLVNALIHRDYYHAGSKVELSIYEDRLEIVSPGRLPNGVTTEKMLTGVRVTRNELIKEVMKDYGYVDHMGMGVSRKMVNGMKEHNGTQPELIAEDEQLKVILRK